MEPDSSHQLDLVPVFEAIGVEAEMEAIAITSVLKASDIPAVLVGSSALPNLPFQVKVPRDHVEAAQSRIKEAKAAGPAAAEEAQKVEVVRAAGLIHATIPTIPSLNLDESLAFYNQLGFETRSRYGDDYALVVRDHHEIHLFACDNKEVTENSGCYIRTTDVRALRAEFTSSGVERISEVEEKPWKMLEFHVFDPSGTILRFGQHTPNA